MKAFLRFEEYLEKNPPKLESYHPFFEKAVYEPVLSGGKRFRPKLILSVVDSLNPLLTESAFPVALGVELLHTYSLIHDDLPCMDDANLRRGHPTLHKKYDETTAVLAGDGLNTYSFYLIASAPLAPETKVELIKELSLAGGLQGMVLGQALDCYFENTPLSLDKLEFLHIHKTGRLIAASLKMGAIIGCGDSKLQKALYDMGIKLGLMFQINDDILDVTKSTQEIGKDCKNDADKNSYVNLLGLDEALKQKQRLKYEINDSLSSFEPKLSENIQKLISKYL